MYGDRIRDLRKKKGLTQGQLADMLGFKSASAVGMIEREEREVSIEALNQLTKIFGVTADYILGKTVEKVPGELDQLEEDYKLIFEKFKSISPRDRQKILKMIEIFEENKDHND